MLTKQATRAALEKNMKDAAQKLKAGDILFLTYSGHGGQLPDLNGDEPDAMDETCVSTTASSLTMSSITSFRCLRKVSGCSLLSTAAIAARRSRTRC